MSNFLKVFGVICGILTFFFCLCSGHALATCQGEGMANFHSFGFFIIGMAFFTGPMLIILSLRCNGAASQTSSKPVCSKKKPMPVKKSRPAPSKSSVKPSDKPQAGSQSDDDLTIIYVGNLSPEANESVLQTAFSGFGEIKKIKIIKDRGRPKGFGFVEMFNKEKAQEAIEAMNGKELAGRPLKVNEAKPKTKRPARSPRAEESIDDEPERTSMFE